MTDPTQIAAKLSKAQRRLLIGGGTSVSVPATEVDDLLDMGLFSGDWTMPIITQLGLDVRRAILAEKEGVR